MSKYRYEVLENTRADSKDFVLVIDDPVSSLDENRIFSTALLIKELCSLDCKQIVVLSHNLIFLKFLGGILEPKKHNEHRTDFFMEEGKLQELPAALRNFQTSYFHKINQIRQFSIGELDYEMAKSFIPNNIRVVLEAFLSFKFCRLKQGSGSAQKYQSAGLDKLVRVAGSLDFRQYQVVQGINGAKALEEILWQIKNKVDPESHGTTQSITDFSFLSKKELLALCRDTLAVIEFLDQIHYSEALQD